MLPATVDPERPGQVRGHPPVGRAGRETGHREQLLRRCSSAWPGSPCWSAASAWPTRWSSRCWNAAPRSACAARWAPPAARSAASSSPSRWCWPRSAGWPAPLLGLLATVGYASWQGWPPVIPRRPRRPGSAGAGGRRARGRLPVACALPADTDAGAGMSRSRRADEFLKSAGHASRYGSSSPGCSCSAARLGRVFVPAAGAAAGGFAHDACFRLPSPSASPSTDADGGHPRHRVTRRRRSPSA